jgi:hypothetical protein
MAARRTSTTPNPGAVVVASGEFLHFTLDAGGPIAIFSFVSNIKGSLFEAPDFPGHPLSRYEWDHLKNPSDFQQLELLDLGLSFLTNAKYTYTVQLKNATKTLATVMKISYTGTPTDVASESFRVVLK